MVKQEKRNGEIEILRFVFSIIIISYHFYSYWLKDNSASLLFSKGYMADEFFFIVTGYYIACNASKNESVGIIDYRTLKYLQTRVKRIAFPFYISWVLAFVGQHIKVSEGILWQQIPTDMADSISELLLIDMVVPSKHVVSSVGWYISGVMLSIMLFYPLLQKFRNSYSGIIAPIVSMVAYGFLKTRFELLYAPHSVIEGILVYKGLIRSVAGINLGFFLYALLDNQGVVSSLRKNSPATRWLGVVSIVASIVYMTGLLQIENDYEMILFIFVGLMAFLSLGPSSAIGKEIPSRIASMVGKWSVYLYFSQVVFYSKKGVLLGLVPGSALVKYCAFLCFCFLSAVIVFGIEVGIKRIVRRNEV